MCVGLYGLTPQATGPNNYQHDSLDLVSLIKIFLSDRLKCSWARGQNCCFLSKDKPVLMITHIIQS